MARAIDKETMLDLIIKAKRTDPETGSFAEWLAEYLVEHLSTLTPPNKPLTLEQLREMDGEPVWVEQQAAWGLVEVHKNRVYIIGLDFESGYSLHWNIYRRPPEGEADA